MLSSVLKTIDKFKLLEQGDKVIAAVSGGPDSVALWHLLLELKPKLNLQLHLAHLDHTLRGDESLDDAEFVKKLAQKSNEPFTIKAQNVHARAKEDKSSIHEAARKLRYQFLFQTAKQYKANKIALGHNADDQAETVLQRFLRGSGPEGLRAIQPKKGPIIRPLLETSRQEIMKFLEASDLNYRQDSSNLKAKYLRNKLRLELIPLLTQEYNPRLAENLVQLADILREEEAFWEEYLPKQWNKVLINQDKQRVVLNSQELTKMPLALQRRLCRKAIEEIKGDLQTINYTHIQQILNIIREEKGEKLLHLPGNMLVMTCYGGLEIKHDYSPASPLQETFSLNIPGITEIKQCGLKIEAKFLTPKETPSHHKPFPASDQPDIALLDWYKIEQPIYIRSRRTGDRIKPYGMKESKKLKNFLIDHKIPKNQRDRLPLLMGNEKIIWLVGIRISEDVKITPETKKILYLKADFIQPK